VLLPRQSYAAVPWRRGWEALACERPNHLTANDTSEPYGCTMKAWLQQQYTYSAYLSAHPEDCALDYTAVQSRLNDSIRKQR
jgi:hypothetical protein